MSRQVRQVAGPSEWSLSCAGALGARQSISTANQLNKTKFYFLLTKGGREGEERNEKTWEGEVSNREDRLGKGCARLGT